MNYISIFMAAFAVFAYTLYATKYDKVLESNPRPAISAIILYLFSSLILIVLVGFTSLIWQSGWTNFVLPQQTKLIGSLLFSIDTPLFDILISILLMCIGYATHIYTEALSRKSPHFGIGLFAIVFQLNNVVILVLNELTSSIKTPLLGMIGAILVIFFSVLPFFLRVTKLEFKIIILAVISAVSCGFSLFIDGNIIRQVVFYRQVSMSGLPLFFFYEFLTFFIPSILVACLFLYSKGFLPTYNTLSREYKRAKTSYFWSALGSTGQFVGSVMALSLSSNALTIPAILATIPFFNVIFDKKAIGLKEKKIEYVSAIGVFIGLLIIFLNQ